MKNTFLFLVCFSLVIVYIDQLSSTKRKASEVAPETTILVQLDDHVLSREILEHNSQSVNNFDLIQTFKEFEVTAIRSVFEHRYDDAGFLKDHIKNSGKILLENWFKIKLSANFDPEKFLEELNKNKSVVTALVENPIRISFDMVPNDPSYNSQWHLNNPSNPNFDIRAEIAWSINTGRNDVVVAVLDGGVDYNHNDLDPGDRSRVIAGIDTGDGNNDPLDDLPLSTGSYGGHGTRIAGIVGARTNNSPQV